MGQYLSPSKSSHVLGIYSMLRLVAGPAANAALANYDWCSLSGQGLAIFVVDSLCCPRGNRVPNP